MIIQWANNEIPNAGGCRKLGSFSGWANMKVQVRDASTFYFAPDKQTLLNPLSGVQGGTAVVKGADNKALEFWVTGDVYAIVSQVNAQVNVDFYEQGQQVTPQ